MKKILLAVLAAAMCLLVVPVSAETFTASNGVLSIELPNENWKEMPDPTKWIVLSDGANVITVEHYANGDALPAMSVADNHYVNVYQAVFSTQNEVFIITGSLVDSAKVGEVCNAILSAKVLQYDTKQAVKKQQAANANEFTIVPMDAVMYVATDGLNVRLGCSTTSEIIGGLGFGASVHVTGKVQRNGQDFGWYQVNYEGTQGYISAGFLTDKAPGEKTDAANTETGSNAAPAPSDSSSASLQFTGDAKTIYLSDGTPVTVYEATDGYWYDSNGTQYNYILDGVFSTSDGNTYTLNRPVDREYFEPYGDVLTVYYANGNATELTYYTDGYFYSPEWVRFTTDGDGIYYGANGSVLYGDEIDLSTVSGVTQGNNAAPLDPPFTVFWRNGNATSLQEYDDGYYYSEDGIRYYFDSDMFIGSDGSILYSEAPDLGNEDAAQEQEMHKLLSRDTGKAVFVDAGGGAFYDENGVEYHRVEGDVFLDEDGNLYDALF